LAGKGIQRLVRFLETKHQETAACVALPDAPVFEPLTVDLFDITFARKRENNLFQPALDRVHFDGEGVIQLVGRHADRVLNDRSVDRFVASFSQTLKLRLDREPRLIRVQLGIHRGVL
jgi:hypothetical protein